MIVKILQKSSKFTAVRYSTNKIEKDKGELLLAKNFGALQAIAYLRPQDYINYLEVISATNSRIKYPQFHTVISTKGTLHDKNQLCEIAQKWMDKMGYGNQPYLLIFHKDTANNHIHIVSTRVGRDGKKIADSYEKLQAYTLLNEIMRAYENSELQHVLDTVFQYNFSSHAQFRLLMEKQHLKLEADGTSYKVYSSDGYLNQIDFKTIDSKIGQFSKNLQRQRQIRQIVGKYSLKFDTQLFCNNKKLQSALTEYLKNKHGLEIIFHAKDNQNPYGYTLIDHGQKNVYKGSDIFTLKNLILFADPIQNTLRFQDLPDLKIDASPSTIDINTPITTSSQDSSNIESIIPQLNIQISDDIDDEAILGRNRQKKKKARTNTR